MPPTIDQFPLSTPTPPTPPITPPVAPQQPQVPVPPPIQPPVQPSAPPPHKNNFTLIAIVILVVVVAIAGIVFAYVRTPTDSTSGTSMEPVANVDDTITVTVDDVGTGTASPEVSPVSSGSKEVPPVASATKLSRVIATIPANTVTADSYGAMIVFSKNGREVMYTGLTKNNSAAGVGFALFKNNQSLGELSPEQVEPSQDGSRVNYVALKRQGQGAVLIINGVEQQYGGDDSLSGDVAFSKDGKNYAYQVWDMKNKKLQVIYNNQSIFTGNIPLATSGGVASAFSNFEVTLDASASKVGVVVQEGAKQGAVIFDTKTKTTQKNPITDKMLSKIVFSPQGTDYAYRAVVGGSESIVLNGKVHKTLTSSGTAWAPVFSLDGKKLLYTTKRSVGGNNVVAVVNISTGAEVAYTIHEFPDNVDLGSRAKTPNWQNLPPLLSSVAVDKSGKNVAVVVPDYSLLESAAASGGQSPSEDDMYAMAEFTEKYTRYYVIVNNVRLDRFFGYISEPIFDDQGKHVMFGVRDGRNFKWMVYEISANNTLIEK